jgi:hypothetical protein
MINLNCEVHALLIEDGRCTCSVVVRKQDAAKVPTGPSFPTVGKVRPKQRHTIMSDANCHYFYIPTEREAEFEAWAASLRSGEQYNGEDFTEYRVGGAICTAMFSSSLAN